MKAWMDSFWLTHEHLVVPAQVVETGAVGLGFAEARAVENERELAPVVRHRPENADAGRLRLRVRHSGPSPNVGAPGQAARFKGRATKLRAPQDVRRAIRSGSGIVLMQRLPPRAS